MSKNNSNRRYESEHRRNSLLIVLVLILFFLLLWALAKAYNFSLFDNMGRFNPTWTTVRTLDSNVGLPGSTGTTGNRGPAGATGSQGNSGNSGSNGSNGGSTSDGINVNVQTDSGTTIDAGVDEQGQLYVDPNVNPSTEGGAGAEASVNDNMIIETHSLFQ